MLYIGQIIKRISDNVNFVYAGDVFGEGGGTALYGEDGTKHLIPWKTFHDNYTHAHEDNYNHVVTVSMESDSQFFGTGRPTKSFLKNLKKGFDRLREIENCVNFSCDKCRERKNFKLGYLKDRINGILTPNVSYPLTFPNPKDMEDCARDLQDAIKILADEELKGFNCFGGPENLPLIEICKSRLLAVWGLPYSKKDFQDQLLKVEAALASESP